MENKTEKCSLDNQVFMDLAQGLACILDDKGIILQVNQEFAKALDYVEPETLQGMPLKNLADPENRVKIQKIFQKPLSEGEGFNFTWELRSQGGKSHLFSWRGIWKNQVLYAYGIDNNGHYEHLHDLKTGLLNNQALKELYWRQDLYGRAILSIDLDNFRVVNDALGHHTGDQVLIQMATKIMETLGDQGMLYRYGGDEFVALVNLHKEAEVKALAEKILQNASTRIHIDNRDYVLTLSMGIAIGRLEQPPEKTINNAYTALYIAKKEKNRYTFYGSEMDRSRTREAILENDLRKALEEGELELYYQPIVDIQQGVITEAETLLRWNHSELGMISPKEFIPIAERTGLVISITEWVFEEACRKLQQWDSLGLKPLNLSVNLSLIFVESQYQQLYPWILQTIQEVGISPDRIRIEITESALMQNPKGTLETFEALKYSGFSLALDDFGSGYSSIKYMQELPVDIIKLDQSLVQSLQSNQRNQLIIKALITIIHDLGIKVVVEGVESLEEVEFLGLQDCDYIQGFYFTNPLPEKDFLDYYQKISQVYGSLPAFGIRDLQGPKPLAKTPKVKESPIKEGHYNQLVEYTTDLIWSYNTTKNSFKFTNQSVWKHLGYTQEEFLNLSLKDITSAEGYGLLEEKKEEFIQNSLRFPIRHASHLLQVEFLHKDGQSKWLEISTNFFFNREGDVEMAGIGRNIEERKKAEEEIKLFGYFDQLTGVYNRNYFMLKVEEAIALSEENRTPLSILEMDLDNFKRVNDTYGHPVGDEVLKQTTRVTKEVIRNSDTLVRFGGEEFILLMENTNLHGVMMVAEKIRKAIEEAIFPLVGHQTVSIGTAQHIDKESFLQWYKRVDEALYEAKNTGRNRVVASTEENRRLAYFNLEWQDNLNSGHPEIDRQHRELVRLGEGVIDLSLGTMDKEALELRINHLLNHLVFHFQYEEELMREIGYPEVEAHAKIHQELLAKANSLGLGKEATAANYLGFVIDDVVLGHLKEKDVLFFPYIGKV